MKCPACHFDVTPGSSFCQNCGQKQAAIDHPAGFTCPSCGAASPPMAKFCTQCGTRLAEGEDRSLLPQNIYERRLTTILFTDVSGFSTFSEHFDPEIVMEIMHGFYPCLIEPVEQHGGTVVQVMGDGLLAFFGAPLAHIDDPERAVRTGLAIQQRVQEYAAYLEKEYQLLNFGVRVGIHTGLVVVGELSPNQHLEYSALGDAVNLAARLQENCPTGGVLVSQDTFRQVVGTFIAAEQPPFKVKGRQQTVKAFLVSKVKQRSWRITYNPVGGVQTSMIGRETEMERLQSIFDKSFRLGGTSLVVLEGGPGVGKSRLVNEFLTWVDLQPVVVLYFRSRAELSMQRTPYALFRDLFAYRFNILESDSAAEALEKFRTGTSQYLDPAQADLVGQLVGFDFSSSSAVSMLQGSTSFSQVAALHLVHYFRQLAERQLLMVFEDIHNADNSSLAMILRLQTELSSQDSAQAMLLCSTRPELTERQPEWRFESSASVASGLYHLAVRALSPRSSRKLVNEILKKVPRIPSALAKQIINETEGNPLFIEEFVKMLIDDAVIETGLATWQVDLSKLKEMHVPPTLVGILQSRLDSLSPAERLVLQRAAVVGNVFWDRLVGELVQGRLGLSEIEHLLDNLAGRELIYARDRSSMENAREYMFKHNLLHETTYETVLLKQRSRDHRQVAEWLESNAAQRLEEYLAAIATHYAQGNQPLRAAEWYTRAGDRAVRLGGLSEAHELFSQALGLLPMTEDENRWRALLGRSEVLLQMGKKASRQADDLAMKEIADRLGNPDLQAETYSHIAYHAYFLGDYGRAAENYTCAIEYAHRAGNIAKEAFNLSLQVANLTRQGNLQAAAPLVEPALELARQSGDLTLMMRTLTNLSTYYTMAGDLARASDLISQQIEINQSQGNLIGEMYSLTNLGFNYLLLGRYLEGRVMLERALDISKTAGARQIGAYTRLNLAMALWRLEDLQEAQNILEGSFEQFGDMGDEMAQASEQYYEGLVLESSAEWEAAEDRYLQARDIFTKLGIEPQRIELQTCLARLYQQMGAGEESLRLAVESGEYLADHGCSGMELPFLAYLSCARVFQDAGELARMSHTVQTGITELRQRAGRISDPRSRQVFLDVPPEHKKLAELYSLIIKKA